MGVLKTSVPKHYPLEVDRTGDNYCVNDNLRFEIDIHEIRDNEKIPYIADDIQLEYIMLDPYIRQNLKHNYNGTYYLEFKAPDIYGIFKFVIQYRKKGYSFLNINEMAPIRPYRHNEFERYLLAAYPYYISVGSMMIGFFALGFVFLYHK